MNKILTAICVVFFTIAFASRGYAQGKAFEKVTYQAKLATTTASLIYADGYIGASQIKLKQRRQLIYQPEFSAVDESGSLRFNETYGRKSSGYFILKNLDETSAAPITIKAEYHLMNKITRIRFRRM